MRTKFVDLTGRKINSLLVLRESHSKNGRLYWLCRCVCGNETAIGSSSLLSRGGQHSCGCLTKKILSDCRTTHGHGKGTLTYKSWRAMKGRCDLKSHKSYSSYGGAGISYDPRWKSFDAFLADMGVRPEGHTLGRIDHKKDYEKSNCEWQPHKKQARERSSSRFIEHQGATQSLVEWARETGIPRDTLAFRLNHGWPVSAALTTPVKVQKNNRSTVE